MPRESHATWKPPADRPDPVALLEKQGKFRVPDLVPVRYGRMMETPFTYYRGAALPMASDLAHTPATGLIVQACGDAHLSNFGIFGSAERKLVFDVNDFDETLPAPWEWDVKRLAASLEVAARENNFSAKDRKKIQLATVARYRMAMRRFAGLGDLDVWYTMVDVDELQSQFGGLLKQNQHKALEKGAAKARTRDSMQELRKLTRIEDGQPRIVPDPPVIVPLRDLAGRSSSRATSKRSCATSSASTSGRCSQTAGCCSSSSCSPTWPARWSAWAASGPGAGSFCCSAGTTPIRSSCRSRRRRTRCSVPTPGPASTATRASAW